MAYFSPGPHTTLKLYATIKQCFYLSRTGSPLLLLRALMLCRHNVGLWVIHTKAHTVDHHATHFRKKSFMFQFCSRLCLCVFMQADIRHKKGKTLNRGFLSCQTQTVGRCASKASPLVSVCLFVA